MCARCKSAGLNEPNVRVPAYGGAQESANPSNPAQEPPAAGTAVRIQCGRVRLGSAFCGVSEVRYRSARGLGPSGESRHLRPAPEGARSSARAPGRSRIRGLARTAGSTPGPSQEGLDLTGPERSDRQARRRSRASRFHPSRTDVGPESLRAGSSHREREGRRPRAISFRGRVRTRRLRPRGLFLEGPEEVSKVPVAERILERAGGRDREGADFRLFRRASPGTVRG
jgi:hypothetical protein